MGRLKDHPPYCAAFVRARPPMPSTPEEYISVSLAAPEFGTIYGNVAPAPGDDKTKKVIIWNSPN